MAVRQGATGHERCHDRDLRELDESPQFLSGPRPDHAAADVEDRALRRRDELGGLADLLAVRTQHRPVAGQVDSRRPGEGRPRLQGIFRDVDEHRPRAPGRGDVEGLGDDARDLGRVGDEVVVLGDRHRDAADVGLLEGITADRRGVDLASDGNDRHRVHVGVGDRGHQVGRTRPRRGHADAHLAGRRGIPLGGVAGALLVADEDVAHLDRVEQRVIGRQDGAPRDPEDGVDVHGLEGEHERLGAGHLHGCARGPLGHMGRGRCLRRCRGRGRAGVAHVDQSLPRPAFTRNGSAVCPCPYRH